MAANQYQRDELFRLQHRQNADETDSTRNNHFKRG